MEGSLWRSKREKEEQMFYKLFAESGTKPDAFIYELPNLILMPNFWVVIVCIEEKMNYRVIKWILFTGQERRADKGDGWDRSPGLSGPEILLVGFYHVVFQQSSHLIHGHMPFLNLLVDCGVRHVCIYFLIESVSTERALMMCPGLC